MINALLVGAANFIFIFLRAFQQRNVAFLHYWWVLPTSLAMSIAEVGVVGAVAIEATGADHFIDLWPMILAIAIGAGGGATASMFIHSRYLGGKRRVYRQAEQDDVEGNRKPKFLRGTHRRPGQGST